MDVISRVEAVSQALTHYFTGVPCGRGHVSKRYTKSAICFECAAMRKVLYRAADPQAHRNYNKKYAKHNVEKVSASGKTYRETNSDRIKAQQRIYRDANRDAINTARREKASANPGARKEQSRAYWERHSEKVLAKNKANRPKFLGRDNHLSRLKKARKIQATPAWADIESIKALYIEAARLQQHVDHVIPLKGKLVSGLHVLNNLQLLEPVLNMQKNNSFDPATHIEPIFFKE